jgi:DNA-directed RNA polymerase specialized sigma24 family protein
LVESLDRVEATSTPWSRGSSDPGRQALAVALRRAIERDLTDKQREVVDAYFFLGESQGEIARRLGITQQVVQKRLFGATRGSKLVGGAIARLRQALASLS